MKLTSKFWELSQRTDFSNEFEFNLKRVFWIIEDLTIFKMNPNCISTKVSCVLWNDLSIISEELFNNIQLLNNIQPNDQNSSILEFNFLNFINGEVECQVDKNFPFLAFNHKEFMNSLKQSMMDSFDDEFQQMVEEGKFISLNEAREHFFILTNLRLNDSIEFKWPIYKGDFKFFKIGDSFLKLFKITKLDQVEINKIKLSSSQISITKNSNVISF
jgi:hypothetical protein